MIQTLSTLALLKSEKRANVLSVAINNPPLNMLDVPLMEDMLSLIDLSEGDDEIKVIIIRSSDPEFFVSHADLTLFQNHDSPEAKKLLDMCELFAHKIRQSSIIFIAEIAGRTSGAGCEFIEALDMSFAAIGKAFFRHPEVSLGLMPCKGGTQMLPQIIGKKRAMEMILTGSFIDAEIAERFGLINRAVMPSVLQSFVEKTAKTIAQHPKASIASAKKAININHKKEAWKVERELFNNVVKTEACQKRLAHFFANGGQTREGELSNVAPPYLED